MKSEKTVFDRAAKCLNFFMYLRAIFCTFQISVDFYFVPVSGRGGGRGGLEKGRGLERGG